jgi:Tfp pilus assembly protein PilW
MDFPRPTSALKRTAGGFTLVELLMVLTPLAFLTLGVITAYLFLGRNFTRLANTQQQDVNARNALFYFTRDVGSAIAFTSTSTTNLTITVPTTLTLANCATTSASATVTCTSTAGLSASMALTGLGIPTTATVSSVTNATTLVMSAAATATNTGLTVNAVGTPATVSYLYDSSAGTLTRTAGGVTTTLLTSIDSAASSPSNGFACYNESSTAVTLAASVKSVEFAFTTKVGTATIGTQSSYKIVSPRVVVRNKQFLP